ncbi:alpha/beta hydrolase [Pseudooceanicola sediminis]|uniref:Alpha/beta hydrolase n=1 Tax=Pseudooceanicola sediminis TaxID=2211117 RepID=A0A399J5C8_9RHOB|nr:alpha/beta hydrolase [Pseudooceanicola sediminis]KAA2317102.1 alpha/beta hydrolase [Puniceibacterium sp. HSS470]RII40554.1 alpha/beta hydrolase [Pseudooceanicola sediminis]|tara:strand:+ start:163389 stop:164474 length:1086 start_codon:yes stop_codon:yes gene_type:complete
MSTANTPTDPENPARRNLLIASGTGAAALAIASLSAEATLAQATANWDKTFPESDRVDHRKVSFTNRYGIALVGDFYLPKDRGDAPLPALAVAGPFGAVKEQAAGLYAQEMAERGFATLAFDPSYIGESGGMPRYVASPDINTEDFMAAVDFLGLNAAVDRTRIGLIGICGFGGMALNATAPDKRVKAVAVTSMYDMSRVNAQGYYDAMTDEQRAETLAAMSLQRWEDAASDDAPKLAGGLPDTLDGIDDPVITMYHGYYKTDRGYHSRSLNSNGGWNVTSPMSFMNMPLLTYIDEISPRPALLIAGSDAHSRYLSEDAYAAAAEPKELMIIDGADHCDLYDQKDIIPFDRLQSFFEGHLA